MFVATGLLSSEIHLLTELGQTQDVLPPLTAGDITALLNSMIGQFPKKALEMTANASNGNPFLAISLLQGMIESGSVLFREGTTKDDDRRRVYPSGQHCTNGRSGDHTGAGRQRGSRDDGPAHR